MKSLHERVRNKLEQSNHKYKDNVDSSRRNNIFKDGDDDGLFEERYISYWNIQ